MKPEPKQDVALYLHIPFAAAPIAGERGLCPSTRAQRNAYLDALEAELLAAEDLLQGRRILCVYVGGGASVVSPDRLSALILGLKRRYALRPGAEVTIAMAPDTLCVASLSGLNVCGFNRARVMMRSASDRVLAALGAAYRFDQIRGGMQLLQWMSYPSLDIGLVYGVRGQSLTAIQNTIYSFALAPFVHHISLGRWPLSGPEEDEAARAQMERASGLLTGQGFTQYAPGLFAREGHAFRFVQALQGGAGLVGLGLGACSHLDGMSWRNTGELPAYLAAKGDFRRLAVWAAQEEDQAFCARWAGGGGIDKSLLGD